jgi:transposase
MDDNTKFVGMDVSKDKIAVAVADSGREPARYWGEIPNQVEYIRKLIERLGKVEQLQVCYEAGPTGYMLERQLVSMGVACVVVAPSLIPKQPGNRVKTDRRDALRLAELFRAGELTPVWVPGEEDEALRDLVRAREDTKEDLLRAKDRMSKFLLRHGIDAPSGVRAWSTRYRVWLKSLEFDSSALQTTFDEYRLNIEEIEGRIERLESEIHEQAEKSVHAPVIKALETFRGIKEIAAVTVVAEVGSFLRFKKAPQVMGYSGVVPSEYSSGAEVHRGKITKTGNNHLRRILIECAWSYRYKASMSETIKKRQEGQPASIQAIAWKAQVRLCKKCRRLINKGKSGPVAVTAVARELLGFIWAAASEVEKQGVKQKSAA